MTLYEDARSHIFRRNNSGKATYQPKTTFCPRCGEQVKIHKITKEECFHLGLRRPNRPRKARSREGRM